MVQQIILIIKSFNTNFTSQVGNNNHIFEIKTGVRHRCMRLLLNMVIDWVIRRTTEDQPRGIKTLEDLDLAQASHTHHHMGEKTSCLSTFAQQIGPKISLKKTEMTLNAQNPPSIQIDGANLPTTEEFIYVGSTVRYDGGAGSDIKSWLSKVRNTFRMLNNVWKSPRYSINTKLKLYHAPCHGTRKAKQ